MSPRILTSEVPDDCRPKMQVDSKGRGKYGVEIRPGLVTSSVRGTWMVGPLVPPKV